MREGACCLSEISPLTGLYTPFSHKLLLGNDSVFIPGSGLVNSTKFKAPKEIIRLSLCLTGLWTYVQYIGATMFAGVLVEVQAARKLAAVYTVIVAA